MLVEFLRCISKKCIKNYFEKILDFFPILWSLLCKLFFVINVATGGKSLQTINIIYEARDSNQMYMYVF